ncbi:ArsR/SmtB family transcription factor [Halorientalis brevis]|uniref:ArsR/SmtB family transcription factor n=1 Tax=Halorientalis brevis TaxID=1126241 RepID=A0ABD6CCY6_9EURY|nr:winged helix-turn-helix domain-containing protein [Halorientalis brevis]
MSGGIDRLQQRSATPNADARVLEFADEDATEILDALSSETSRQILTALFEESMTPSEVATSVDTSVQNVHYHLSKLEDADLIERIETVYSEKGNEMHVYGPTSDPLVFVGDDDRLPNVRQSLVQAVSGLGLLGIASLCVQWAAERLYRRESATPGTVGSAGTTPGHPGSESELTRLVFEVFEPGLVFFVICLVIAAVVALTVGRE